MAPTFRTLLLLCAVLILVTAIIAPVQVRAATYTISFEVAGLPSGVKAQYYVDAILNGTIQSGELRSLEFSSESFHTLSVDLTVPGNNGTRYQCKENLWSFGSTGTHTFTYTTQFYLEVSSPYGSPSGTGWYDKDAKAYARLAKNATEGPEGVRYVFAKWDADASGSGATSDPIVMDRAKKALALWKTQYILRVSSEPPEIFSPSPAWFDSGSVVELSAPNGTAMANSRYVFMEWTGDYNGTDPHGSIQMDKPKLVTAKYKAQYLLSVSYVPPDLSEEQGMPRTGWYDAGELIILGPVAQFKEISPVERLAFISWQVDNMTQQGTSVSVSMDSPHHIEVTYRTQYYLSVTSNLGETIGSGWYFSGDSARFSVTYSGSEFPVKYTLADWKSTPKTAITRVSANEAMIIVDRAYSVEAVWNADYTPAWVFIFALASAGVLVTGGVVVAVKRPGSFGRVFSSLRHRFRRPKLESPTEAVMIPPSLIICQRCGAGIASSAGYCQSCGAPTIHGQRRTVVDFEALDERVYDYIVKRRGEISLSRTSKELGISVEDLKNSTERLKKKGRLA